MKHLSRYLDHNITVTVVAAVTATATAIAIVPVTVRVSAIVVLVLRVQQVRHGRRLLRTKGRWRRHRSGMIAALPFIFSYAAQVNAYAQQNQ